MSKAYARVFQKGEIDYFGVRVKSADIFEATSPTFELRACADWAVIVPETAAAFVGTGPFTGIKEVDIKYNLDTTNALILPGEEYVAIFGLNIDGIRKRLKKLHIRIEENPCT